MTEFDLGNDFLNVTLLSTFVTVIGCGYMLGYWVGVKIGGSYLFRRKTLFLQEEIFVSVEEFFDKYGTKPLCLLDFLPEV
jgi:membrane protein DedA with SNARE-associated domain